MSGNCRIFADMKREVYESQKAFAGEKKPSMLRRCVGHDYTERMMYMVTMVTEGRRPLFGTVVGRSDAPADSAEAPRIELSALGQRVSDEWMGIPKYYPQVEIIALQMMPDHLHGILFVKAPLPVHLGQVISGFKAGCRKAVKALAAARQTAAAEPLPTEKASEPPLTTEKASGPPSASWPMKETAKQTAGAQLSQQATARPSQSPGSPYRPLFSKGYNDLILRSYDELPVWQNYLRDNPRRLLMKRTRPEWLRPFFGLQIGAHTFSGIGNRSLLAAPKRMAVRVSRRLIGQEMEAEVGRYLDKARQGTVLVSPAISPGEKKVMRMAFDAGLATIVIMENGFTPMSKPHGEQFYACAKGHLLMLSPWEHHNEKRPITATQCRQMNLMALEICEPTTTATPQ